jgi:predicted pyridoxine 5'-phosphate oxidase superfamily flavin-nucleotide-binding protein
MTTIPESILSAWEDREGPVILTTVDSSGMPNSIYVTCVGSFGGNQLVVADNYFNKTRANIKDGSKGSILFMTKPGKAYQVKGSMSYQTEGAVFDDMKCWNPEKHPGNAAAALTIEEAYSGGEKLL